MCDRENFIPRIFAHQETWIRLQNVKLFCIRAGFEWIRRIFGKYFLITSTSFTSFKLDLFPHVEKEKWNLNGARTALRLTHSVGNIYDFFWRFNTFWLFVGPAFCWTIETRSKRFSKFKLKEMGELVRLSQRQIKRFNLKILEIFLMSSNKNKQKQSFITESKKNALSLDCTVKLILHIYTLHITLIECQFMFLSLILIYRWSSMHRKNYFLRTGPPAKILVPKTLEIWIESTQAFHQFSDWLRSGLSVIIFFHILKIKSKWFKNK